MKTALTMRTPDGKNIDIAPGFREQVWQLLLDYFDYLQILDNRTNQEDPTATDHDRNRIHQTYRESEEKFYNAVSAIEKEFLRLELIHYTILETVGLTLIQLNLDGREMHVRTLSIHWWRFIFERLDLPFPVIFEIPPHGPGVMLPIDLEKSTV
ncbi:MAG: hypothetical protein KBB51_03835 [Candidatus Moranbacteria bacterium]|jgi:hypothetical protein|nr:hypothetical protein [Candidatus Moranbacteria bacterium]